MASDIENYVAEHKADDGLTYLEQVESHIVDMKIMGDYLQPEMNNPNLRLLGDDIICKEEKGLLSDRAAETMCKQVLHTMDHINAEDFVVAFTDVEPIMHKDLASCYVIKWRVIARLKNTEE